MNNPHSSVLLNPKEVNNQFYNALGKDWWEARDHMIYFLRAESQIKVDYLLQTLATSQTTNLQMANLHNLEILDLGAGAGFVSIALAKLGARVTALDSSTNTLEVLKQKAQEFNLEDRIDLVCADACDPLDLQKKYTKQYDLVLAFDVLEHVALPLDLIKNAANCLKPNGIFLYHTLNRSLICWLLYLQILPKLIRRDPGNIHQHKANIKPSEMLDWLEQANLRAGPQIGMRAPFLQKGIWELLTRREIATDLKFEFTKDLSLGYLGHAKLK